MVEEKALACFLRDGYMNKPDISVIVPVYNTERYLPQCLDSILSQSFKDFEVIVVNDCSPDNSDVIIDEYASRDQRVKPLHLGKNVGLGFARNAAIDMAVGKYLVMVDSDDYLNLGALKTWFDAIEEFETDVVFAWFDIQEDKGDAAFSIVPGFNGDMFNKHIPRTNYGEPVIKNIPSCWQGIYRIDFLRENKIQFELHHREDHPFVINVLLLTEKISLIPEPLVIYRRRHVSTLQDISIMQKEFDKKESFLMLEHVKIVAKYFCRDRNVLPPQVIKRRMEERFLHYSRLFFKKILPELQNTEGLTTVRDCLFEFSNVLSKMFSNNHSWHIEYLSGKEKGKGDIILFISLLMEGRYKDALAFLHYSRLPLHKGIDLLERISDNDCRLELRKVLFRYPPGTVEVKGWEFPPMALHIGLTKTGTTYLQNILLLNRERLLEQGILFPETGIYREPGDSLRMSGHHYFKSKSTVSGYEFLQKDLQKEINSYGGEVKRLILSCENFALEGTDFPVRAFHDFWGDTKVKIVLCVRRQDECLRSMYVEAVTGGWARFSGSVEDYLVEQDLKDTLDYYVLAHHWIKEFGRENVEVIFMERAAEEEGGLWASFCLAAEIKNYGSFLQPEKKALNEVDS